MMDNIGNDLNDKGTVMPKGELEEVRKKKGECITCGQKCYQRGILRMTPITIHGKVLEGRCLDCKPLEGTRDGVMPAVARVATPLELNRFKRQKDKLRPTPGGSSVGTTGSSRSRERRSKNPRRRPSNRLERAQSERGSLVKNNKANRRLSTASTPTATRSVDGGLTRAGSMDSTDDIINGMSTTASAQQPERHPDSAPHFEVSDDCHHQIVHNPGHRQASTISNTSAESGATSGSSMVAEGVHPGELDDYTLHSIAQDTTSASESYDPSYTEHGHRHRLQVPPQHRAPSGVELQEALHQMAGRNGVGAISTMGASDMAAHPNTAALLDYYRRTFRESEQSISSNTSNHSEAHSTVQTVPVASIAAPSHGVLNRGGAISFQDLGRPPSVQGLGSSSHRTNFEGGRRASSRYVANSSRSLDSMSSFGDEPSYRYGTDPVVEGNLNESLESSTNYSSGQMLGDLSERTSASSARRLSTGVSVSSHQSRTSNLSCSSKEPGLERLAEVGDGNFVEVLNIMRDYPDSMGVQLTGMQMLSEVNLTNDDYETVLNVGVVHVIMEAMDSDPANAALQIVACRALLNACGSVENQCAFCEAGIVNPILRSMDTFPSNDDMQEQAMAVLANLGAAEPNLSMLLEEGVIGRIIEAMENHSEKRHVQMKGCSAITNFASHTSPLKKNIMDLGGGGAVVVTMSLNQSDSELQEKALRALRNLSANSDDNKLELAHIGGVDSVVTAMQIHRDEAGVQEAGAWSLSNLAGHFENKRLIGECGGVDVTIRAMWVHTQTVSVQEWCIRALFTLTLEEQNCVKMIEVGGLSAVISAMQAHVESPAVQEMGCAVLCNLASNQERRLRIVDEEALDAIVLAMVVFSEELMVQQQACQVLVQLAITENFTAMQASNIPSLVQAAAGRFDECREPADWLLNALNDFALHYTVAAEDS